MRPNYSHPAAPARAIPPGEEPVVTRAKVCAQLRTALQILDGHAFDREHIAAAQVYLKGAQRVLFVAQGVLSEPTRRDVSELIRVAMAVPALTRCACTASLTLEMERDLGECVNCQARAARVVGGGLP